MEPMKPMKPLEFRAPARWWPDALGNPDSTGSQNDLHYAYFASACRLLLSQNGQVTTYETGDHKIYGVSQAGDGSHAQFTSDHGTVELSQLRRL